MSDSRYDYPVPLYKSTLTVLVCDEFPDLASQATALGVIDEDDEDYTMCRGVCWEAHLDDPPRPGASVARWVIAVLAGSDINIVAHEATHATLSIALYHGLPISGEAHLQEPVTYLAGWVVEAVQDAVRRHSETRFDRVRRWMRH